MCVCTLEVKSPNYPWNEFTKDLKTSQKTQIRTQGIIANNSYKFVRFWILVHQEYPDWNPNCSPFFFGGIQNFAAAEKIKSVENSGTLSTL